jgi:hypothetical protein
MIQAIIGFVAAILKIAISQKERQQVSCAGVALVLSF